MTNGVGSGFKEEGRKRRANWVDGHWEDSFSMGVLDEEWAEMYWTNDIPVSSAVTVRKTS